MEQNFSVQTGYATAVISCEVSACYGTFAFSIFTKVTTADTVIHATILNYYWLVYNGVHPEYSKMGYTRRPYALSCMLYSPVCLCLFPPKTKPRTIFLIPDVISFKIDTVS
jgi:hypothetical protein